MSLNTTNPITGAKTCRSEPKSRHSPRNLGADNDGSSAFKIIVTPVRIVCANTQRFAIDRAKATFSIRHTNGARAAIQDARNALGLTWRYMDAFEAEAAALYAAPMELDMVISARHSA